MGRSLKKGPFADLAMCRLIDCYGSIHKKKLEEKAYVFTTEEAIKVVFEAKLTSVTTVNKLYKRHIFNELRYQENIVAEDAEIVLDILMKCQKVVFYDAEKYYYIHRESSITTRDFNSERGYDVIRAYEKNYYLIQENYPNLIEVAQMRLCWANFKVLDKMILKNVPIDKNIVEYLRKKFLFIMKNDCFTKNRKIGMIFLMININLYKIIVKRFNNQNRKLYS